MTVATVGIPILFFICFFGFAFFINNIQYRQHKKTAESLVNSINPNTLIKDVKADVYTLGARSGYFNRFRWCDMYFTNDSLVIIGYSFLFRTKIYAGPTILTHNDPRIKRLNTDSFNHEVYIDFTKSEKPFHNIEIHLKGLSGEQRSLFSGLA